MENNKKCPYCKSMNLGIGLRYEDSVHYIELKCNSCKEWIIWLNSSQELRKQSIPKKIKEGGSNG